MFGGLSNQLLAQLAQGFQAPQSLPENPYDEQSDMVFTEEEVLSTPPAAAPAPAPAPTVPEAIAAAQANASDLKVPALATAQPAADDSAVSGPFVKRSWAEELLRKQDEQDAARKAEIMRALQGRKEPGADPIIGPNEQRFTQERGSEFTGNRFLAALSRQGVESYNRNRDTWMQQREAARAADREHQRLNRPISNAMVGLIARTNPDIPVDSIANLREGDPLVKLLGQGGMGHDLKRQALYANLIQKEAADDSSERRGLTSAGASVQSAAINAAARKKGGGGGGGGGGHLAAQQLAIAFNNLTDARVPITEEEVQQALAGKLDMTRFTPEQQAAIRKQVLAVTASGGKDLSANLRQVVNRQGGLGAQVAGSLFRQSMNAKEQNKLKNELDQTRTYVVEALSGWQKMSPQAKELIAKVGSDGWVGALSQGGYSEADQQAAGKIYRLINQHIKDISGAAVTGPEWQRLAKEMGLSDSTVSPFKSPTVLGEWLKTAGRIFKQQRANAIQFYPNLYGGGGG